MTNTYFKVLVMLILNNSKEMPYGTKDTSIFCENS